MKNEEKLGKYLKQINITKFAIYPLIIIGTIIISGIPFGFDLNKILTYSFLGSLLLKVLLQIMWSYFGMEDGEEKGKQNPTHIERADLSHKSATMIKDKGLLKAFKEYNQNDYLKKRQEFIEDVLFANQIDKKWYEMDLSVVIDLYKMEKKGIYAKDENGNELPRLDFNRKQLRVLKALKKGNFRFEKVSAETILSGYEIKNSYNQINDNVRAWAFKQLGFRLLLTILSTAIIAGFEFGESKNIWGSILLAVVNIALSISVYFIAFKVGIQVIEKTDAILELKDDYIHCFIEDYENGKFIPSLALYSEEVVESENIKE